MRKGNPETGLDFDGARAAAEKALRPGYRLTGSVAPLSVGWAFAVESSEDRDPDESDPVLESARVLIVDRRDGTVHRVGAGMIETHLRLYEARWARKPPPPGLKPSDGITGADLTNGETAAGARERPFERKW